MRLALFGISLLAGLSVSFLPVAVLASEGKVSAAPPPANETRESIWSRAHVIGASASAGFRLKREAGHRVNLAKVLRAAIHDDDAKIGSTATAMFFMQPLLAGDAVVRKTAEAKPTIVFAIDFLFWFGYGIKKNERQRLEHLERGIAFLETLDCPIVISKIPDMSDAIGKMLFRRQVPKPETLEALNRRIDDWAKSRKNIVIIQLVEFFEKAKKGDAIKLGQTNFPKNSIRRLLQRDELHPTVTGLSAIAILSLETIASKVDGVSTDHFERDAVKVARELLADSEKR